MHATTIAVDLAKSVFQVSLANQANRVIDRKRLTRSQFERFISQYPATTIIMEACATANYWSQYAQAHGHSTKLLHAFYVRPYVRRNKTDAADADALLRASRDPELLPIPTKQPEQQALQSLHRCRQQLIETRTARVNFVRGVLAEFGISLPRGVSGIGNKLSARVEELPVVVTPTLIDIINEIGELKVRINGIDKQLEVIAKHNDIAMHLLTIPGIGVITATAMVGCVPDIHLFKKARQFSAWLGITPREHSSGNKRKLGAISKQGNNYLRTLLIHGARSAMLQAHRLAAKDPDSLSELQHWVLSLETRRPRNVATVAMANKMARIIWVTWSQERDYQK
jgi:transposase